MKGELRTTVARRPEEVFDFLADIRNEAAWNPRLVRAEQTTPGPIGAGTTFEGQYRGLGALRTELIVYERPTRLGFRSDGRRMQLAGTFSLVPVAGGTDVALEAELAPKGLFRLLAPLMRPVIERQNADAARRLKEALEGAGARASGSA